MKKLNKNCLDNTTCKFSEAYYQKMASKRYGIDFCCEIDMKKLTLKKQLNDLSELEDVSEEIIVCPAIPDNTCLTTCITFNEFCNDSYDNFMLFLTQGQEDVKDVLNIIDTAKTLFDEDFAEDITLVAECFVGNGKCFDTLSTSYRTAEWKYWGLKLTKYTTPSPKLDMLEVVFTAIHDKLITLDGLFTTFYDAYDTWILNDYAASFLPVQLANTVVTYTSCQGVLTNNQFAKRLTIYNNANTNITFRNQTFDQSPNRASFDYDAFMKRRVTIIQGLCFVEECVNDGHVYPNTPDVSGNYYFIYNDGFDDSVSPSPQAFYNYSEAENDAASLLRAYTDDKKKEVFEVNIAIYSGVNPNKCALGDYPQYYPLAYPYAREQGELTTFYKNNDPASIYVKFPSTFITPKSINSYPTTIDYILYYDYGIGTQPLPADPDCNSNVDYEQLPCDYFSCNTVMRYETFLRREDFPPVGEFGVGYRVDVCEPSHPYDPLINYSTFYWNPVDKEYSENSWFGGDMEDCSTGVRARRDAYLKALNEFTLATGPFASASLHVPGFQISEFKTDGSVQVTECSFGPPTP